MQHRSTYRLPNGEIDWSHPDVPEEMFGAKPVPPEELGVVVAQIAEYAAVPREVWTQFPPAERLLLALHFAYRAWKPSEPGGWYRLSKGLQSRAGLDCREMRRRAVNSLLKRGLIDVRRNGTRTTLVRLRDPGPKQVTTKRISGGAK